MRLLSTFAILVLVAVLVFALIGWWINRAEGKRVSELLKQMDDKYDAYMRKRMTLLLLDREASPGVSENLREEALQVIEPEIQSLISLVRTLKSPVVRYRTKFFPNVQSLARQYFSNETEKLTEEAEARFYRQAADAIEADIRRRELDLQIGNLS